MRVQYSKKSVEELKAYAPFTIVCDSLFSNLRRALCSPRVQFSHYNTTEFCGLPNCTDINLLRAWV